MAVGPQGCMRPIPVLVPSPLPASPFPAVGGQRPGKAHALLQAGAQQQAAPQNLLQPPQTTTAIMARMG